VGKNEPNGRSFLWMKIRLSDLRSKKMSSGMARYLRGSHSVFGKLLRHQVHLKLTLDGYLPKEMDLANGPTPWVALNGVNHADYWILKECDI
jgi:hypothetical protein